VKYSFRPVAAWLLVLGIAAAIRCDVLVAGDLVGSDRLVSQPPIAAGFIETWEGAATARLPDGPWQLAGGAWGAVAQQDVSGAGRRYAVAPGQDSQLRRAVSFAGQDHVVLEGWLHDPGPGTHSMLGLASMEMVEDAAAVRIGAAGQGTYRVQYFDAQGSTTTMRDIDTGAAVEPGWHFLRLDLVRDIDRPDNWLATWRIWNVARTVEKRGSVVLQFDVDAVAWATLGSATASAEGYAWDRVRVGSIRLAGPPPALEAPVKFSTVASSQLDGWEVGKLLDCDPNTVYSSHGHGEQSRATEWIAFDFGLAATVSSLQITPRAGGFCFPIDYEIQYSTDMANWHTVPGQVHRGQQRPEDVVTHVFAAPVHARGLRVHATCLGSDGPDGAGNHYLQLADLEVPRLKLDTQPWIRPGELRTKSVNSTGIFSTVSLERAEAPTPQYLAEHPEYLANHPFDGVTVAMMIDGDYTRSHGLVTRSQFAFHEIGMSSLPIPWSAVARAVADLQRVQWGHCTNNFMWYGVSNQTNHSWEDGDRAWWVDPQSADDWQIVVANAAVAARAAREAGLRGFLVDTEQYTKYPIGDHPEYPWGLGEAAMWKERGRQWIAAVQGEYPNIVLQFFFSWGDEYHAWPHYQNLVPFMNGVLEGIRHPARIVHAWESTFWNGQARETPPGSIRHYPGDRAPYAAARDAIRNIWRTVADDPAKYNDFVDVGMAAWLESDPWNLWPGLPSGYLGPTAPLGRSSWPSMPWSNLAATLAYSDKYVWTWSEKTNYPATAGALNPFLASIANQTFNTGTEAVRAFHEDFAQDPMARGWYFDFSFLEIGRRKAADEGPPQMAMTTDAVAYAWSPTSHAVQVRGHWTRGEFGEIEGLAVPQRRRYVRPITPLTRNEDIHMQLDFTVEDFGQDAANPMLLGLFHSEATADAQTLCVRMASDRDLALRFAGDGTPWSLPLAPAERLSVGRGYRLVIDYHGATRRVSGTLVYRSSHAEVCKVTETVPATVGPFVLDEAGIAQREEAFAATAESSYRFRLEGFQLHPPQSVAADH